MIDNSETLSDVCQWMIEHGFLEVAKRILAAHKREVAELRECLKEAIREKCPFTRMNCKHGEPCDYECGTYKWRKALEGGAEWMI